MFAILLSFSAGVCREACALYRMRNLLRSTPPTSLSLSHAHTHAHTRGRATKRTELQISAQNRRTSGRSGSGREDVHERAIGDPVGELPPRQGGAVSPRPHRGGGHEGPTQPARAAQRQRRGEAKSSTKH